MLVPLNVRTYRIAIVNGIISMAAIRLADQSTILPLLVHKLSGAAWVVGLTLGACTVARALMQIVISRRMDTLEFKLPDYVAASWLRGAMGVLTGLVLWYAHLLSGAVVVGIVALASAVRAAGTAWGMLGFNDVLAKSVPTTRRGSLQMWRRMLGLGIALVVVAPFVSYMIGPSSPYPFPENYALLFLIGTGLLIVAWVLFSRVHEPPSRPSSRRLGVAMHLTRGVRIVRRDKHYRRLIRTRLLLGLASGIRPFFVVFGAKVWGLSDQAAATFLALQLGAEIVGSIISGRMSDRHGNRRVLIAAALSISAAGTLAVAAAVVQWPSAWPIAGGTLDLRILVLGMAFVFGGLFLTGHVIGTQNYMLDIAPQRLRPSYQAFASAFTVPLAVAPVVYGWAADAIGFRVVFVTGLVLALGALVFAGKMPEPRDDLDDADLDEFREPPTAHDEAPPQ